MKRASHGPLTASRPVAAQESPVPAEMDRSPPTPACWAGGLESGAPQEPRLRVQAAPALPQDRLRVPALASLFTPAWRQGLTFLLQGLYPKDLRVRARGCIPLPSTGG